MPGPDTGRRLERSRGGNPPDDRIEKALDEIDRLAERLKGTRAGRRRPKLDGRRMVFEIHLDGEVVQRRFEAPGVEGAGLRRWLDRTADEFRTRTLRE